MTTFVRSVFAVLTMFATAALGQGQTAAPNSSGSAWAPPVVAQETAPPAAGLPRWFCTLEGAAVWTWFGDAISPSVPHDLPTRVGSGVAPQVALGFRFEDNAAVLVNYRYLSTSTKPGDEDSDRGSALLHTNWTGHWLDLDYQSPAAATFVPFAVQWQAGLRVAHLAYTIREEMFSPWGSDEVKLEPSFLGAGPHLALLPRVNLGQTGFSLFGLADLGFQIGCTTLETKFKTTWHDLNFGHPVASSHHFTGRELQVLADLRTEVGIGYTSVTSGLRFEGGFRYDASVWGSRVFSDYGPFVRVGVGF